ncbi:hypothetical protein SAMN05216370_3458 [Pseudomonas peli]|uniref:Uncharacterized protein n=1 Tax=Pseudomonas peli TaxID=592361 RepID=A0AB37ZAL9_9PSED|nr:hypothetical protein SAMN05216370_3458 [Pseudomonas peli]
MNAAGNAPKQCTSTTPMHSYDSSPPALAVIGNNGRQTLSLYLLGL